MCERKMLLILNEDKIITQLHGEYLKENNIFTQNFIGKSFFDLIKPEQHKQFSTMMEQVWEGNILNYDGNLCLDENEHAFVITFSPLQDKNDTICGFIGMACEVIDTQYLNNQKNHRLKNELTSINAYIQLLDKHVKKSEDEKSIVYVSKIKEKIHVLQSFILQDLV